MASIGRRAAGTIVALLWATLLFLVAGDASLLVHAGAAGCIAPPANLVSWYPGDGSAIDIADANNGTLIGNVTFAAGKVGQGFNLPGSVPVVSRVEVPDAANLQITGVITLDAWVSFTGVAPQTPGIANSPIVAKWGDTTFGTAGYGLFITAAGTPFFAVSPDGATVVAATALATLPAGVFKHVAGVWTGAALELYVDGALAAATPFAGPAIFNNVGTPLLIGGYNPALTNGPDSMIGVIDEVEVYNRNLGAVEIAAIFNAGSAGKCKDFCEKGPVKQVLDPLTGRFPGNTGPDVIVRVQAPFNQSIQAAIDAAVPAGDTNGDGYIIIAVTAQAGGLLGGHVSQSVLIDDAYTKPFALIACSVTLHDPTPGDGNPTARIAAAAGSPQNIFVMDLHAADCGVAGWKVEGNGRYLRNVAALTNATGVWFLGDSNTMHNGAAEGNTGVGILVQGNGNTVDSADSFANGSHGIQVAGNSNGLIKTDVGDKGKGNGGDGLNASGDGNLLSETSAFANAGDGVEVSGNNNQLVKNVAGDSGKGNGGDGILVAGTGNALQENRASGNTGDGFDISGGSLVSANKLKKSLSNTGPSGSATLENGGAEYRLLDTVRNDGGGNKADSIAVPKTAAPQKCPTFPPTNTTVTFAVADVCE